MYPIWEYVSEREQCVDSIHLQYSNTFLQRSKAATGIQRARNFNSYLITYQLCKCLLMFKI